MRRTHRWVTPAASSPKYQRPSATWRSCAQKSTKTRYERSRNAGEGQWWWQWDVCVNRRGYQRWKESKVPETDGTVLTTIIELLRAERGTDEGWEGLIFNHRKNRLRTVFGPLFHPAAALRAVTQTTLVRSTTRLIATPNLHSPETRTLTHTSLTTSSTTTTRCPSSDTAKLSTVSTVRTNGDDFYVKAAESGTFRCWRDLLGGFVYLPGQNEGTLSMAEDEVTHDLFCYRFQFWLGFSQMFIRIN